MQIKFTLEDTIEWMKSDDYKIRLKAEYWQIVIRLEKLRRAIVERFFEDDYIQELKPQFDIMRKYKHILEQRAIAESIDLDNDDVVMW
jgi:hypothetical protein